MRTTTEIIYGNEYQVNDYGYIINQTICNIFEDEMTHRQLKKFQQFSDEETYLVVKTRLYDCGEKLKKIHYMIQFNNDDKPVLELRYCECHSCDMNYHLGELESQQEDDTDEESDEDTDEENEEVYEIKINGTKYYTTNETDGMIYSYVGNEIGDGVGSFIKGKVVFNK